MCAFGGKKIVFLSGPALGKFVGAARAKEKNTQKPCSAQSRGLERRTLAALAACRPQGGKTSQGKNVHWGRIFMNHGASKLQAHAHAWSHDPNLWNPHAGRDLSICALHLPNIAQGCLFSRPKTRCHGPRSVCLAAHPRGVVSLLLHQAVVALARRSFLELFFGKIVQLPQHAFCLSVQREIQI